MEVRTVFRCCGNIQISRTAVLPGTVGFTGEKDPQPDQICSGYGCSADDRSAAEYRKYLFQAQCSGIWRFEICAETIHHWLL